MPPETDLTSSKYLHNDFSLTKTLVYDPCGFSISGLMIEKESHEYGACHFRLNGMNIQFRVSKITPTKTGQFVTIWKRNDKGITTPFSVNDAIDFLVISSRNGDLFGQFIFPKSLLVDKCIITGKHKEGKRGIRVYPPWDKPGSKQAEKTQRWQTNYFYTIQPVNTTDFALLKQLFNTR